MDEQPQANIYILLGVFHICVSVYFFSSRPKQPTDDSLKLDAATLLPSFKYHRIPVGAGRCISALDSGSPSPGCNTVVMLHGDRILFTQLPLQSANRRLAVCE